MRIALKPLKSLKATHLNENKRVRKTAVRVNTNKELPIVLGIRRLTIIASGL